MHSLTTLDYAIILGYLGLSLVLGLIMSRRASSSLDHYFLGGRRCPGTCWASWAWPTGST